MDKDDKPLKNLQKRKVKSEMDSVSNIHFLTHKADEILIDSPGEKMLLLGNEAIVRGALEAGVSIASTYPGTPASEIGDTFFKIAKRADMYFEYSVNEKVALETGIGASISGLRAITSMKHVGLNVASDAFITLCYIGVKGGHVVITADDPSCHSSQNEQDNRYYALLANVPMLEPSSPDEAKEMTKYAFDLSEELELPVLLRTTTRLSHARGVVILGEKKERKKALFVKDPFNLVCVPQVARERHKVLLKKMNRMEEIAEHSSLNKIIKIGNGGKLGIVTSGIPFNYAVEALEELNINASILKLGIIHPLPSKLCQKFIGSVDMIVIIEELEPYLEVQIKSLAKDINARIPIYGKSTGHFPRVYEYTPNIVLKGISDILGMPFLERNKEKVKKALETLPSRPPTLCPGCPHRATYYAANAASKGKAIYPNDIGCYALGIQPPSRTADLLICMGAGIGTAGGFSKATEQPIIAFIGDSTFYHAGIPALLNAVHNKHRFVLVILDNRTTAMTGNQPHPGFKIDGMGEAAPAISIEKLVEGCGVDYLKIVDPYDVKKTKDVLKEALEYDKVAVVIARRECALIAKVEKQRAKYHVNQEKCKKCMICVDKFGCPAFFVEDGVHINKTLCFGCGVCTQICPFKAIEAVHE